MKFSQLETQSDLALVDRHETWLDDWYRSVRNVEIADLELGDLCRAVRQRIFPGAVISFCVQYLQDDILAGDDYEGQLIFALTSFTPEDWKRFPEEAAIVRSLICSELPRALGNSSVADHAYQVLEHISGVGLPLPGGS